MSNFDGDVAEIAGTLRALSGQHEPPYSTARILEVSFPTAIVAGRQLPDGIEEAVSATCDGPLIVYRRQSVSDLRRVAEAHAIAHLVFDLERQYESCAIKRELRADAFALELLAPDHEVREFFDLLSRQWAHALTSDVHLDKIDAISSRFHVPTEMIGQRIRHLRL